MKKVRDQVRQAVSAQTVVDDRERDSVAEFLVRFDQLDRPFDESAGPIHVTGSAIVLGTRGIVMHLHKRLHRWLQPGGHIDPDETPWDAAWRETLEETGLRVRHANDEPTLIHVDVHPGPRGHTHLDLRYLFFGDDSDPSPPPGESQDVRWFAARGCADAGRRQSERLVWSTAKPYGSRIARSASAALCQELATLHDFEADLIVHARNFLVAGIGCGALALSTVVVSAGAIVQAESEGGGDQCRNARRSAVT